MRLCDSDFRIDSHSGYIYRMLGACEMKSKYSLIVVACDLTYLSQKNFAEVNIENNCTATTTDKLSTTSSPSTASVSSPLVQPETYFGCLFSNYFSIFTQREYIFTMAPSNHWIGFLQVSS